MHLLLVPKYSWMPTVTKYINRLQMVDAVNEGFASCECTDLECLFAPLVENKYLNINKYLILIININKKYPGF